MPDGNPHARIGRRPALRSHPLQVRVFPARNACERHSMAIGGALQGPGGQNSMGKYIFLIWKNVLRNGRRSVLTVLSMAISVFLIGVLLSIYAMFYLREVSDSAASRLVTRHRVSLTQALPTYYGRQIAAVDGVETVIRMNWFGGTYIDNRPEHHFPRFAVDQDEVFDIYTELRGSA